MFADLCRRYENIIISHHHHLSDQHHRLSGLRHSVRFLLEYSVSTKIVAKDNAVPGRVGVGDGVGVGVGGRVRSWGRVRVS